MVPGLLGFRLALWPSPVIGFGQEPPIVGSAVHHLLVGGRNLQGVNLVLSGGGERLSISG
jgi:hypothetical protein